MLFRSAIVTCLIATRRIFPSLAVAASLGCTILIVPFLYQIGFGFDGFLHRAAERAIVATGTITPKPLAYIGQYFPLTAASKLFHLPVDSLDRWFVPLLFLCIIFLLVAMAEIRASAMLALLLLPLSPFIATTPQAAAFLLGFFGLAIAAFSSVYELIPLSILSWACLTHPLAGAPFLLATLAILSMKRRWTLASIGFACCSILAVPFLFLLISHGPETMIAWNTDALTERTTWSAVIHTFLPWMENRFVLFPAWSSLIELATPTILILFTILGLPKNEKRSRSIILLATGVGLHVMSVLLNAIGNFSFLIRYEQSNYADRLHVIGTLILILASLSGWERVFERTRKAPGALTAGCVVLLLLLAAAQSYNALPRNDAIVTGHGWSVGAADRLAAQFIENDSRGEAYTVLANQSVSAAAVDSYGFKRYTSTNVFYYPIPTGGPLYAIFERLVYGTPSRDLLEEAGTLGQSSRVYVALDDYWWMSEKLRESLKHIADANWTIGSRADQEPTEDDPDGTRVFVYRFDLTSASSSRATFSGR